MPYYQSTRQTRTSQESLDRCAGCDFEIPDDDVELCPYCGRAPFRMGPEWQRARAIIRWYGPADTAQDRYRQAWVLGRWPIRRRTPVNRLLLRYWEQVRHAKTLVFRGYSERRIAEIQGISKTTVHHRLQKPFSLIRSEIRRITAWLAGPELIGNIDSIGIDQPALAAAAIDRYKAICTRYGWICFLDRQIFHQQRRE